MLWTSKKPNRTKIDFFRLICALLYRQSALSALLGRTDELPKGRCARYLTNNYVNFYNVLSSTLTAVLKILLLHNNYTWHLLGSLIENFLYFLLKNTIISDSQCHLKCHLNADSQGRQLSTRRILGSDNGPESWNIHVLGILIEIWVG